MIEYSGEEASSTKSRPILSYFCSSNILFKAFNRFFLDLGVNPLLSSCCMPPKVDTREGGLDDALLSINIVLSKSPNWTNTADFSYGSFWSPI